MKKLIYISLALSFFMISCEEQLFEAEPENNPVGIFEELWSTFDEEYGVFEERGVDWDEQYTIYKPMVTLNTTDDELFDIIKLMLNKLDDGHVQMTVPNKQFYFANNFYRNKIDDDLFNLDLIENSYFTSETKKLAEDHMTLGWIGDVGYVHARWIFTFEYTNDFLDYFADAKGLIIDLRHDGGGDFTWVYSQFGRLTQEERYVCRSKTKNGPGKDDYTEWYDWYLEPKGEFFDKPIVCLTDPYTISAAERMAYIFKALPNAIQMGDATNGSIGTKIGRELANGWKFTIVTQKIESFDGKFYEGVGIPPDVYIKNTMDEMNQGIDKTLETAIERLN